MPSPADRPPWRAAIAAGVRAASGVSRSVRVSRATWLLLAILVVGAVLRIAFNDVARYTGHDEKHYVSEARTLAEKGWSAYPGLVRGYLDDEELWLSPTPVRWGYLGMAAITCAVRAPCDARSLAWLSTIAGVAAIALVYLLGARLVGKRAALLAAAFTVTSPLELAMGRRALQDEVYCAVFLAAFWALVRMVQDEGKAGANGLFAAPRQGSSRRADIGRAAVFVAIASLAFAVKEAFVFPYIAFAAVFALAPRARRLRLSDALVFALPPLIFFAGFAASSRSAGAFMKLLAIANESFLSPYSLKYQSGPPHRPLFDLFLLAPVVCVLAAGAIAMIAARRASRPGGERWLALFLALALAAFVGLPKNARFVIILDPVLRLLAAWTLVRHHLEARPLEARPLEARPLEARPLEARPLEARPRWWNAIPVAAVAAPELWLFHTTFIQQKTYDPTTHEILLSLGALPGTAAVPAPRAWPLVFLAAVGLAVAGLLLARRRLVSARDEAAERAEDEAAGSEEAPKDGADAEGEGAVRDPFREGAEESSGTKKAAPSSDASKKTAAPDEGAALRDGAPDGSGRAWTIGIAAVCVVAALFIGRSWGAHDAQGAGSGATSSSDAADPAADEVNAGLAAADPTEAVAHFRKALEINPTHYGATFQLARALDRAGRKDEAQKQWERVLRAAEQQGDQPLVDQARARLGQAGGAPPVAADPMAMGLDALYNKHDPATAAARFRDVLAQNPDHYGATFQLATALDQAGDIRSSRPVWDRMVAMADAAKDQKTLDAARARLAEIDKALGTPATPPDPDADAMKAGLEALYTKHDVDGAIKEFRGILKRNPTHYGATYQLAVALDSAKKDSEARPLWEKVLKMAEAIPDEKTVAAARARLTLKH